MYKRQGLADRIIVDSCGTGDWHIGHSPDPRAIAFGKKYGYDLSPLKARQLCKTDFKHFDFILAMDKKNLSDAQDQAGGNSESEISLFLSPIQHDSVNIDEVPDPYYGGDEGFDKVIQLCEIASDYWLDVFASKLSN